MDLRMSGRQLSPVSDIKGSALYCINKYAPGESNNAVNVTEKVSDEYTGADPGFDASRSNPIYGSSTTVQPPAISLIPQLRY